MEQSGKIRQAQRQAADMKEINEHVNDCQICQTGTLCDTAERILNNIEAKQSQQKEIEKARRLRQAGL